MSQDFLRITGTHEPLQTTVTLTVICTDATEEIKPMALSTYQPSANVDALGIHCIDTSNSTLYKETLHSLLQKIALPKIQYTNLHRPSFIGDALLERADDAFARGVLHSFQHCSTTLQLICTPRHIPTVEQLWAMVACIDADTIAVSLEPTVGTMHSTNNQHVELTQFTKDTFQCVLLRSSAVRNCMFASTDQAWTQIVSTTMLQLHGRMLRCTEHTLPRNTLPTTNATKTMQHVSTAPLPRVLAIIPVTGRNLYMLERCIHALDMGSANTDVHIVVIVCPSETGYTQTVTDFLGNRAEVLGVPGPFNFPKVINIGLQQQLNEEYVLLLNDDCFFRSPDDITRLIATMKAEKLACIGPWVEAKNSKQDGYSNETCCNDFRITRIPVMGCCALWDSTWLHRIGTLDEQFGIGYGCDESDLTWRARIRGARWGRDERVIVDHIHHATFGSDIGKSKAHMDNLERWKQKYGTLACWGGSAQWDPLPGIQVVIAVHNGAEWLDRCLQSVEQALNGYRWIVTIIDDASTDGTRHIIEQWQTSADQKIFATCTKSKSAGDAKNKAIALGADFAMDYPIVCLMDADDIMTEDRIRYLLPTMVDNAYPVVFGDYIVSNIRRNTHIMRADQLDQKIGTHIHPCSTLIHRNVIPKNSVLFNPEIEKLEDEDVWRRWYRQGIFMQPISGTPVHHYVQHTDSVMGYN